MRHLRRHHLLGHLLSVFLRSPDEPLAVPAFPHLALLVSGGHTMLIEARAKGTPDRVIDAALELGPLPQAIALARELFEASQESDFYTLMRAYQFAKNRGFSVEACRRYGIHAQTARQRRVIEAEQPPAVAR